MAIDPELGGRLVVDLSRVVKLLRAEAPGAHLERLAGSLHAELAVLPSSEEER